MQTNHIICIEKLLIECQQMSGFHPESTIKFVNSVSDFYKKHGYISQKQENALVNILETDYYPNWRHEDAGDRI